MKNDEYNSIKITNEKNSLHSEFSSGQKAEFTSFGENKQHYKDELNHRHTINDNIEENVLNSSKKKNAFKKEDYKKIQQGPTHLSSTAGHMVVAATTVSVAVVGSMVGLSIFPETSVEETITFISSEITSSSIDFSFSMPSKLLRYEQKEDETGQDYRDLVVYAQLANSDYYEETWLEEYEKIDEDTLVFYWGFYELTANTDYGLTISLGERQSEPSERKELAFRSFTTKPEEIPEELLTFESIEAGINYVDFSFKIDPKTINYSMDNEGGPVNEADTVYATVTNESGYYESMIIEGFEQYDEKTLIGYGYFSDLNPDTFYNLDVYKSSNSGVLLLGSTYFVTEAIEFGFKDISADYSDVSFSFMIDPTVFGYGTQRQNPVHVSITSESGYYDDAYIQEFEEIENYAVEGYGSFSNLEPNTDYQLTLIVSTETEEMTISETSFSTLTYEYGFTNVVPGVDNVYFSISVAPSMINYSYGSFDDTYAVITGSDYNDETHFERFVQEQSYVLNGSADFSGLYPNSTYNISIYSVHDNEDSTFLFDEEFTTEEATYGFEEINPGMNYVDFSFTVNPKDINRREEGTGSNVIATIYLGNTQVDWAEIEGFEDMNEYTSIGYGYFSDLTPDATYRLDINVAGALLCSEYFTTLEQTYGFNFVEFSETADYYAHTFTFKIDYFDDAENPNYSSFQLNLKDSRGTTLQTFDLDATTEQQTLTVSSTTSATTNDPIYDYDLDQEFNYELTVFDASSYSRVTLDTGSVSFGDADLVNFSGVESEFGAMFNQLQSLMPIKLNYNTDYSYDNFKCYLIYESNGTSDSDEAIFYATLEATTDWQLADFSNDNYDYHEDYDGKSGILQIRTTRGDEEKTIYETNMTISRSTRSYIYGGKVTDTTLDERADYFSMKLIYESGSSFDSDSSFISLVDQDTGEEFRYTLSLNYMPSGYDYDVTIINPTYTSSGTDISNYTQATQVLTGRYSVYIYFAYVIDESTGSVSQQYEVLIGQDIEFTFN